MKNAHVIFDFRLLLSAMKLKKYHWMKIYNGYIYHAIIIPIMNKMHFYKSSINMNFFNFCFSISHLITNIIFMRMLIQKETLYTGWAIITFPKHKYIYIYKKYNKNIAECVDIRMLMNYSIKTERTRPIVFTI